MHPPHAVASVKPTPYPLPWLCGSFFSIPPRAQASVATPRANLQGDPQHPQSSAGGQSKAFPASLTAKVWADNGHGIPHCHGSPQVTKRGLSELSSSKTPKGPVSTWVGLARDLQPLGRPAGLAAGSSLLLCRDDSQMAACLQEKGQLCVTGPGGRR